MNKKEKICWTVAIITMIIQKKVGLRKFPRLVQIIIAYGLVIGSFLLLIKLGKPTKEEKKNILVALILLSLFITTIPIYDGLAYLYPNNVSDVKSVCEIYVSVVMCIILIFTYIINKKKKMRRELEKKQNRKK
ncbi:hypothetical protein KQI30_07500 [Clostridium bornimense]|uniref:hypothetical protein n=1 Tax=Clostridium bornimense TaxID=1216932 RepID=UPI001C113AD9|nr:hypothetical protein [Clostridium bornimense]MBU5316114.1 hypothetical protein [Clostridium bornimense]